MQKMNKQLPEGDELEKRCLDLGIDIQGERIFQSANGRFKRAGDYELQLRLSEALRSRRESRLWLLALISAIASVASAVAAFLAVASK